MHVVGLAALLSLLGGAPSLPQTPYPLPKGQLVENVASGSAQGQRFTIYVPSGYEPSLPTPILYLMDPRGRGRVAAKLFQPAAERFGYVLVSSHNSASDGPAEVNLRAMQAMWDDSHAWFNIDSRRVYVAGFSGTARIASLLGRHMAGSFTGVIGSAAAYHPDVRPARDERFLYFGTVGDADYNFHEMESLERSLVSLDLPHRVERFAGGHSWMPADLAMRALEWMELRAMGAGTRARDPHLIEAWWARDARAAQEAAAAGRQLDAARLLAAMGRDFAALRDTAGVRAQAVQASASAVAKAQLKQRQASGRASSEFLRHVMGVIADAFPEGADAPTRPTAELAVALDLGRLKKLAGGPPGEAALEAQRRLNEIGVQLGFYLPAAAATSEPARARYYLTVALQIDDRAPVTWYLLARSSARLNANRDALTALERAYEAGFRDAALLDADPAFTRLRANAGYQAVVARIRASGDVLDSLTVDRPPALPIPPR